MIEEWVQSVRTRLLLWSGRLLEQETWKPRGKGHCSWSLVELYTGLCSLVDEHAGVMSAHTSYATLLERALSKIVLSHATALESLCQVRARTLPKQSQ